MTPREPKSHLTTALGALIAGLGLLCVMLVVMKLMHMGKVAEWPWWAVTAPAWVPVVFAVLGAFVVLLVFGVTLVGARLMKPKKRR